MRALLHRGAEDREMEDELRFHLDKAAIGVPVALLIGAVALAACLLPARRAAAVDPMSVLRQE